MKTLSFPQSQSLGRAGEKGGEGGLITALISCAPVSFKVGYGHSHPLQKCAEHTEGWLPEGITWWDPYWLGNSDTESHSRRCDNHVIQRAGEHLGRLGELWCGVVHRPAPPPSTPTQSEKDEQL